MAGLLDANSLEFSIMPFLFCHMTIFYTLYIIMRSVVGLHFQLTLKKKWMRKEARQVTSSELQKIKMVRVYRTMPLHY